jgi:hypothetical protein
VQVLPVGSAVDLQVSGQSVPRQAQFVLQMVVQKRVRVTSKALTAHILSTAPARIAATLDAPPYKRIQHWRYFQVKAGASIHTLKLRHKLKPGTYTLYWLGRTADGGVYRTSEKLNVISTKAKAHTATPAQIVVTVKSPHDPSLRGLESLGQTVDATPAQTFGVASDHDASVIVVDADAYGLQLVTDLRTVFPGSAVIALSKRSATLLAATRDGAVAVPASTPPAKLAKLVARYTKR